jgi:hypothetical protein
MIPIFIRNRQTGKWEIFPLDELETLHDGYLGLDSKYWGPISDKDPPSLRVLSKYRKYFVRDDKNAKHGPCRYIFLPGLPRHTRWRLRVRAAYHAAIRAIPNILTILFLLVAFIALAAIFLTGAVVIVKWLIW